MYGQVGREANSDHQQTLSSTTSSACILPPTDWQYYSLNLAYFYAWLSQYRVTSYVSAQRLSIYVVSHILPFVHLKWACRLRDVIHNVVASSQWAHQCHSQGLQRGPRDLCRGGNTSPFHDSSSQCQGSLTVSLNKQRVCKDQHCLVHVTPCNFSENCNFVSVYTYV